MKKFLAFDVGCIECGEDSSPIGVFDTHMAAEAAIEAYLTGEPNGFGRSWGRPEWKGDHWPQVFEIEVAEA